LEGAGETTAGTVVWGPPFLSWEGENGRRITCRDEEVDFDKLIRKVRIWQSEYLPGHPAGFLSAKKDVRDFNPPLSAKASAGPCRT